jgi:hypothetical protein
MLIVARIRVLAIVALCLVGLGCSSSETTQSTSDTQSVVATDPLPSWNDGPLKTTLLDFIQHTSSPGDPEFVPEKDRIATFDNDGTLWVEQPMYTQLAFALDRVKTMAPDHPEWRNREPFRSVLAGDMKGVMASGQKGLLEIVMTTHAGMSNEAFEQIVKDWIATATHPTLKRPYTQCVYLPMLELMTHLRARGYKTYIVSGGGVEFMRPWTDRVYGIPPEQVVGSSGKTKFEMGKDGKPVLMRLPEIEFIDDGPGKPLGINRFIGHRPIIAFGNSDGDQQMLEWTAAGAGPRLVGLIHHTDAAREFAYDKDSSIGRLDKALTEAIAKHWLVVDMKNDWGMIFPARQ